MATAKKRKLCSICHRKFIIDKMKFESRWFCVQCYIDQVGLGTGDDECPQVVNSLQESPRDKIISEFYSSVFWLTIAVECPLTFSHMLFVKHGLVEVNPSPCNV